jgi:hypothetical protein
LSSSGLPGSAKIVRGTPCRSSYKALQLRVQVDEDRTIRLSGMFSPSLHLSGMIQEPPVDPSKSVPRCPRTPAYL